MSLLRLLACLVLVLPACAAYAAEEDWPLVFPDEPGWTVEKPDDEVDFFVLTSDSVPGAFFTLGTWPFEPRTGRTASAVRRIADGIEEETGWFQRLFRRGDGYEIVDLKGPDFSGEAALWRYWGGDVLVVFMIADGEGGWNGQFSGSGDDWEAAKSLLVNVRRASLGEAAGN